MSPKVASFLRMKIQQKRERKMLFRTVAAAVIISFILTLVILQPYKSYDINVTASMVKALLEAPAAPAIMTGGGPTRDTYFPDITIDDVWSSGFTITFHRFINGTWGIEATNYTLNGTLISNWGEVNLTWTGDEWIIFDGAVATYNETKLNESLDLLNNTAADYARDYANILDLVQNITISAYARAYADAMDLINNNSLMFYSDTNDTLINDSMKSYSVFWVNETMRAYVDALNSTMTSLVGWYNGTMKVYADALDLAQNTTTSAYARAYADAMDIIINNSMKSYAAWMNDTMKDYVLGVNSTMDAYVDALNSTMTSLVDFYNGTMKTYADALDLVQNTTISAYARAYADAMDIVINNSMKSYSLWVNGTMQTYVIKVNETMDAYVDALDLAQNTTISAYARAYADAMDLINNNSLMFYSDTNDTLINNSLKSYALWVNSTMDAYVDAMVLYFNDTHMAAYVLGVNETMRIHVEAVDLAQNTTTSAYARAYADARDSLQDECSEITNCVPSAWDAYSDFMGTTTATKWCLWDGSEIDCNVEPVIQAPLNTTGWANYANDSDKLDGQEGSYYLDYPGDAFINDTEESNLNVNASTFCNASDYLGSHDSSYYLDYPGDAFLNDTEEGDLNVNASDWWDSLDTPPAVWGADPYINDTEEGDLNTNASVWWYNLNSPLAAWTQTNTTPEVQAAINGSDIQLETLFMGSSEGDSYIYFYEDGSATGEYLKWSNTFDEFQFFDDVYVGGSLEIMNSIKAYEDIYTIDPESDLWLGSSTQAAANWQAYADGSMVAAVGKFNVSTTGELTSDAGATFAENVTASTLIAENATLSSISISDEVTGYQIDGVDFLRMEGSGNLFLGTDVAVNEQPINNLIIGYKAGENIAHTTGETGRSNVYIGVYAGQGNTAGVNNTGMFNVALGKEALRYNTVGQQNFALGFQALNSNTEGSMNIAIGAGALTDNIKGTGSIGIGRSALTNNKGDSGLNVAIGREAGMGVDGTTTSHSCVWIGTYAGKAVTGGNFNTAIGHEAGDAITSGWGNTVIGKSAGGTINTGVRNTVIGMYAGGSLTSGDDCILVGYGAGQKNTADDRLIIDKLARASVAEEANSSIIYGVMANTPADQTLTVNALLKATQNASIGSVGSPGCITIRDSDDGGWSHIQMLNGAIVNGTGACN